MPFLCGGRPSCEALPELLHAVEQAGASIVEIGFPFSDPIADGPVIAGAFHRALQAGATPDRIFQSAVEARGSTSLGLVAMASVSIAYRMGVDRFVGSAKDAGFDGVLFPDAPLEESAELIGVAHDAGLTASLLIGPAASTQRAQRIAQASTGFVYLLARAGVTGERDEAPEIAPRVATIREATDIPIACGFGISSREQVRRVLAHADAAIVGSALVRRIEQAIETGEDVAAVAGRCVSELLDDRPASAT